MWTQKQETHQDYKEHVSNQGLEVCSFFSGLIIGLVRSKPLHWDQGWCLSLVPLLCCTIPHQSSDKPRGRPEVVERKWMYFMFGEHVVWLRGAHIKCCGLGKPPVEKQDASSVESSTDWRWCCSEVSPAQSYPACLSLGTNSEIRDRRDRKSTWKLLSMREHDEQQTVIQSQILKHGIKTLQIWDKKTAWLCNLCKGMT